MLGPSATPPGAPTLEDLRVGRRLAVGGMAELFLAEWTPEGGAARTVVLKRALDPEDQATRTLLARELEAYQKLTACPHVVQVLGGGDGYLVLEWVDGPDLAALLAHLGRRGRRLPLGAALAVVEGLAGALEHLHAAGLVHRDVSPANLLVGADGAVKLIDLGVVQADVSAYPTVGGFKGTLAYMAPEQLLGEPVGPAADLYAAGLVAYEALTGVPARPDGELGVADLLRARSGLPEAPSGLREALPEALDEPLLAALAPAADARPASAGAWWSLVRDAAGRAPEPAALARAVGSMPARKAVERVTMDAPAVLVEATEDQQASSPRPWTRRAVLGLLGAGAAAVLALRLVDEPTHSGPRPKPRAAAVPPAPTPTPEPKPVVVIPEPVVVPEREVVPERVVVKEPVVLAEPVKPKPRKPPKETKRPAVAAPPPPVEVRVEVRSAGAGPVHVSGAGVSGLAPRRVGPLAEGGHVLELVGGAGALPATLRLRLEGDAVTASIGAPAGRYYHVTCGGRALGTTPRSGLRVRGKGLRCRLETEDGAAMAFVVARVTP